MKLKKAIDVKIDYPSREAIKPILAGVGMALAITACSQTVAEKETIINEPKHESRNNIDESINPAGGMPAYIPPPPLPPTLSPTLPKEQNSSTIHKFKKKITPPELPVGVPAPPRSK